MSTLSLLRRIGGLLVLVLLASVGCDERLSLPVSGSGGIELVLVDSVSSRLLLPRLDMAVAAYRVEGSGPDGAFFGRTIEETELTVEGLAFGPWRVGVSALNAEGTVVGAGHDTVTVHTGETVPASVTILPISGHGELELSVTWNETDIDIPQIDAELRSPNGTVRNLDFSVGADSATYTGEGIDSGYHTLVVQLLDNGIVVAGAVEVARIAAGSETVGEYRFDRVNKPGGTIAVAIQPEMAAPLTVAIAGARETVSKGARFELEATVAEQDVAATYVWYVNGVSVGTGATFGFDSAAYAGKYYRIDATAFSADGSRAGSATASTQILPAPEYGLTWRVSGEEIDGPKGTRGTALSGDGRTAFIADKISRLLRSEDRGATWTEVESFPLSSGYALDTDHEGRVVVATDLSEIAVSLDSGDTWQVHDLRAGPGSQFQSVAVSADGTTIAAAGHNDYLYTSTDGGATWVRRYLREDQAITSSNFVRLSSSGTTIVANRSISSTSICVSTDGGETWTFRQAPSHSSRMFTMTGDASTMVLAGRNAIWVSEDFGASWRETSRPGNGILAISLSADGSTMRATLDSGQAFVSRDGGTTWSFEGTLDAFDLTRIVSSADGSVAVASGTRTSAYRYDGAWKRLSVLNEGPRAWFLAAMSADASVIFVNDHQGAVYRSVDLGATWELLPIPVIGLSRWHPAATSFEGLDCSANGNVVALIDFYSNLYFSTDAGESWTTRRLPGYPATGALDVSDNGEHIAAVSGTTTSKVHVTSDLGLTWVEDSGLGRHGGDPYVYVSDDGRTIMAASDDYRGDVILSTDAGASWSEVTPSNRTQSYWRGAYGSPSGDTLYLSDGSSALLVSEDRGNTWSAHPLDHTILGKAAGSVAFLAYGDDDVWVSADEGLSWHDTGLDPARSYDGMGLRRLVAAADLSVVVALEQVGFLHIGTAESR